MSKDSKIKAINAQADIADALELPLLLQTQAFRASWQAWCKWRRHVALYGDQHGRKPLWTDNAARRIITKLERIGEERAIRAIAHSVDRWQDVYEPAPEQTHNGEQPAKWEV